MSKLLKDVTITLWISLKQVVYRSMIEVDVITRDKTVGAAMTNVGLKQC